MKERRVLLLFFFFFTGWTRRRPHFGFPYFPPPPPSQQLHPSERTKRDMRMKDGKSCTATLWSLVSPAVLLVLYLFFCFFTSLRSFSTASRFIALKGETIKSRGPTKSWTARGRNHSPFFLFCFVSSVLLVPPKDRRRRRRKLLGCFVCLQSVDHLQSERSHFTQSLCSSSWVLFSCVSVCAIVFISTGMTSLS